MTLPLSKRQGDALPAADWRGICTSGREILDDAWCWSELEAVAGAQTERAARRTGFVRVLRRALLTGRGRIAARIAETPRAAHRAIVDYVWLTDRIVVLTLDAAHVWLHPLPTPTAAERLAVFAIGGYGRAEMAPHSDVDLLFLHPYKKTAWSESLTESVLYSLWDLKLKVGHAMRTADECLRLARSDITIRTSLLEHRQIWGAGELGETLRTRLWTELFDQTGAEFVQAKLAERADRHERQGSTRYLLEPNIKEGKGGLRDLQTLYWIAKYLNRADHPDDLLRMGVFRPEEYRIFTQAQDFLWMTRVNLHLLTGRATERLTFDTQVEIASTLGYAATDGQQPVERFMQDYFTHAKHVGDLTRIFLAGLEAQHVKPRPSLGQTLRNVFAFGRDRTAPGYRLKNGRIDLVDPEAFLRDPVNILRLFEEGLATDIPIHPDALRLIAANLDLIDDTVRADPEANRIFLALLVGHNNPERALRLMNELGVLGAFIPAFGRIVAMMQFNMYHRYTVDEHTIQAISQLSRIERRELVEDLPVASGIVAKGVNRRVLYVALLLHDIGKGASRPHSEIGAEIARSLCPRLGLDAEECEMVEWLVRHHLLMSDVAQKRDLTEPRTVRDFARIVTSPTRLKLLTVLTVCDIRGVGPGIWNNWKAMLLRALHAEAEEFLTGGSQTASRPAREAAAKAALAEALTDWSRAAIEAECARHYPPYWLGFDTRTHRIFAGLVRTLDADEPAIQIHFELDFERDATQACFAMADHPGIFSRLAGALALAGANVVDARTYTTTDGIATAAFWTQDAEGKPYEQARLARLRATVARTLRGEVAAGQALRDKQNEKRRERDFVVPTRISFDNTGSDIYTIIEVETRDRLGLVHDIARTLTRNNISIASAIIATYGKQAVDVFYVKDLFGLKLHSEAKRRSVEARLRAAIAPDPDDEPLPEGLIPAPRAPGPGA